MTRRYEFIRSLTEEFEQPPMPEGYEWQAGDDATIERLAELTSRVFSGTVDAKVWPILNTPEGLGEWLWDNVERLNRPASGVVMKGDRVVGGIIVLQDWPDVAELLSLGVDSSERGANLGLILLRLSEQALRDTGVKYAKGIVASEAERLVAFYVRNGYSLMNERWIEAQGPVGLKGVLAKAKRKITRK